MTWQMTWRASCVTETFEWSEMMVNMTWRFFFFFFALSQPKPDCDTTCSGHTPNTVVIWGRTLYYCRIVNCNLYVLETVKGEALERKVIQEEG